MNIGYVFDEGFACCAATSICSLLVNNADKQKIDFWIFDDGISIESKERIERMILSYGCTVTYKNTAPIIAKLKELQVQPWRGRYSAYIKLLVNLLLPEDLDRITIIDADTIVNGSILELNELSLDNYPCAMALEGIHADYHKYIGLENSELFNTGVIVYNLSCWRFMDVDKLFLNHLMSVNAKYMLPEEDPISLILRGKVYRLEPKFNFITQFYLYNTECYFRRFKWDKLGEAFYSFSEINTAQNDVRIYHCIDTFTNRPWNKNNIHPFTEMYDCYLQMTEWGGVEKTKINLSFIAKIEYLLRKYLPHRLSIYMYFLSARHYYTNKARKFYESLKVKENE